MRLGGIAEVLGAIGLISRRRAVRRVWSLSGRELIGAQVFTLIVMGGWFHRSGGEIVGALALVSALVFVHVKLPERAKPRLGLDAFLAWFTAGAYILWPIVRMRLGYL
jgi:hypothetical protein